MKQNLAAPKPTMRLTARRIARRPRRKRVQAARSRSRSVRVVAPARTIPVSINQKTSNKALVVQTATMSVDAWKNLPPTAQYELSALRPGLMQTPYVENNGMASKLATCVLNGQRTQSVSNLLDKYTVVTLCPIAAASDILGTGTTGCGYRDNLDATSVFSFTDVRGAGFTDFYGSATYASRITPYASRCEVKIEAAEATIAGVAFIGSMAVSSFVGSSVNTLIDNATNTVDLKNSTRIELKSVVNNRNLIHFRAPGAASLTEPLEFADEFVSYCVFDKNTVRSITDGSSLAYNTSMTLHTNAVWWPVKETPSLAGIVSKMPVSTVATTPAQDSFCKAAETNNANPSPVGESKIKTLLAALLNAAQMVPAFAPYISAARSIASLGVSMLSDPRDSLPDYSGIISDLEWCARAIDGKYKYQDQLAVAEIDRWLDETQSAIEWFRGAQKRITEVRRIYSSCTQVQKWRGTSLYLSYVNQDGDAWQHNPGYIHCPAQPINMAEPILKRTEHNRVASKISSDFETEEQRPEVTRWKEENMGFGQCPTMKPSLKK